MGIYSRLAEELQPKSFEEIIQFLIDDENEAIEGYEKSKEDALRCNLSSEQYDNAFKVFDHIISEEQEHIKELQELLNKEV